MLNDIRESEGNRREWIVEVLKDIDGMHTGYLHKGELVRCKECRYCKKKRGTFKGEPIIFYRCEENNRDVENDDYCSFGERSK